MKNGALPQLAVTISIKLATQPKTDTTTYRGEGAAVSMLLWFIRLKMEASPNQALKLRPGEWHSLVGTDGGGKQVTVSMSTNYNILATPKPASSLRVWLPAGDCGCLHRANNTWNQQEKR